MRTFASLRLLSACCAAAVLLFILFVGRGEFWLVLPALICFSIGLAFVLVLLGVLVVRVPRFASSRFGESRLVHSLPIISADTMAEAAQKVVAAVKA